ncbi:hypothetical protein AB0D04_39680 [Streptomyces sp. NPDC048483]|uniref:hypothetical protein n=1 Tax=Streptomyces sp. NPDC048483 TaxID=3154927 RepID=UPI00341C076A
MQKPADRYEICVECHQGLVEIACSIIIEAAVGRTVEALSNWTEIAPGCVMNRTAASASNRSKPYQSQLIRQAGFSVPDTLVTNDPDVVRDFRARHGRLIYKSVSAVRSVVRELDDEAAQRLLFIRGCPVQFPRYVPGTNVWVHVVAQNMFGTATGVNPGPRPRYPP